MISIDFDPAVLSYDALLKHFWAAHRCDMTNSSRQYMNALFYHGEEQKKIAEASREAAAKEQKVSVDAVKTQVLPVGTFTYAEGYHQKYYLTRYPEVREVLAKIYPSGKELADSTVAARLNAYLGSGMTKDWKQFEKNLSDFGLPDELEDALRKLANRQVVSK